MWINGKIGRFALNMLSSVLIHAVNICVFGE